MRKPLTVADIRADKELGRGSCSIYDEAHTDAELQQTLDSLQREGSYVKPLTRRNVLAELRAINKAALSRMAEQMDGWY